MATILAEFPSFALNANTELMGLRERASFLKRQVRLVYKDAASGYLDYLIAITVEAVLFCLSLKLDGESEALFALIYVISAILIAIFLGAGPGMIAGVLAALSVDYHYIGPLGKILTSTESILFLVFTLGVVQLALLGIRLLQGAAYDTEQARVQLEKAVHAREEILAVVAHDLRQPLSVLALRQQLAQRNLKAGQVESVLQLLRESQHTMNHMDNMIQDLLDGSKVDAGELSLSIQKADLEEIVKNAYENFYLQAAQKHINLRFNPSLHKIPLLSMDTHRMGRVLSNLLSNAIKFTPANGEIELSLEYSNPKFVDLRIKDSGPGIRADDVQHLFHKHWQEKTTAHLGTGLGLYICHGIIAAHKGSIRYESSPNAGAIFCVRLPVPEHVDTQTVAPTTDSNHL